MKQKTLAELDKQVAVWNQTVPIGSEVEYHPVIDESDCRVTKTRSAAFVLSGHTACVFVEGQTGCVALDACVVSHSEVHKTLPHFQPSAVFAPHATSDYPLGPKTPKLAYQLQASGPSSSRSTRRSRSNKKK